MLSATKRWAPATWSTVLPLMRCMATLRLNSWGSSVTGTRTVISWLPGLDRCDRRAVAVDAVHDRDLLLLERERPDLEADLLDRLGTSKTEAELEGLPV